MTEKRQPKTILTVLCHIINQIRYMHIASSRNFRITTHITYIKIYDLTTSFGISNSSSTISSVYNQNEQFKAHTGSEGGWEGGGGEGGGSR